MSKPLAVLLRSIGMDTMASYVGSVLACKSSMSYPNTNSPLPYVSKNTMYSSSKNAYGNSICALNMFVPYLKFVKVYAQSVSPLDSIGCTVVENMLSSMYFCENMVASDSSQIGDF